MAQEQAKKAQAEAERARAEAEKARQMAEQAAADARANSEAQKRAEADAKKAAEAKKQAEAKNKAESAEADESKEQQQEQTESTQGDPVTGTWEGSLYADQLPEGSTGITLKLKMDGEANVTGTSETQQGSNELKGKYNAGSKKLTLGADNGQFTINFSSDVGSDKMEGMVDINDGAFAMDFDAKRTEKPEVKAEAQEQQQEQSQGRRRTQESNQQEEGGNEESAENQEDEADDNSAKPLSELMPGPRWVSSLEASRYRAGRVYISMDGHRSNDDEVYVFASENYGRTWRSIKANVPTYAGSVRVIREDIENPNVLYLGCEFSAWVSIDRGKSWTKLRGMPTVAVHEIAQHKASGDLILGTHGRGVWIGNSTLLRQLTPDNLEANACLYEPNNLVRWRREASRGKHGTHSFVGRNPSSSVSIFYSLGDGAEDVSLVVSDLEGNQIREYKEMETEKGLHSISFDGRRQGRLSTNPRFRGRRFGGAPLEAGKYLLTLTVDGNSYKQTVEIVNDPSQPEATATQLRLEYEEELKEAMFGSEKDDD